MPYGQGYRHINAWCYLVRGCISIKTTNNGTTPEGFHFGLENCISQIDLSVDFDFLSSKCFA